jgi:hypothetical protein
VPVSCHSCVAQSRRWIRNVWLFGSIITAHQMPSANHSLLWALSAVGAVPLYPVKRASWKLPVLGGAGWTKALSEDGDPPAGPPGTPTVADGEAATMTATTVSAAATRVPSAAPSLLVGLKATRFVRGKSRG